VDGGGYLVVRGTTDPSTSPNANGIYAVNNTVTSGQTVVYIGTATSFTDTGLTNGTTYYYRIYTVDKAFNYSAAAGGAAVSAAPAAPTPSITGANTATAFTTTYGTASANQSFSISGSNLTANLVATAPTGFEVSSDGTTYASTATFTQSSGSASGTLRIRLSATAVPGGAYNSQNIALTSAGATTVNIATAASGNTVSQKALTITGLAGANKAYDGLTTASATGTAAVSGLVGSDSVTLGGTPSYNFSSATVGAAKSITTTGYTISSGQSSYYTLTQPTGLTANITTRALTITANSTSKVYNNVLTSSASGSTAFTPSGLQNSETIGSVTLTYAGGYNATDSAGTYTITPSAATGGNFTASNYALTYANGTLTVTAIVPSAPTITAITPGDQELSVAFTAPASTGGSAITNYEYSTDGGTNWTTRSPIATTSPLAITGLTNGTPYNVQIRAVNTAGSGAATASTSGTPAAPSGTLSASGTLSVFSATYPDASAEQSFTVSGSGLTGSLTVTAPSGFEVSLISGSGFGATATISASGTLASTTVYVRLAASSNAASYSGNVTISGGSATTQNVAATGTVSKATPTVSAAPTASDITYGQTLASSTLTSGTASVNGTFAFTTPATAPSVGTASQNVTFTPTDGTNYNTASTTASVTVNKATPTVSVAPTASGITYGQTLASSTLSGGTASVAGTFAFSNSTISPAVGTASQNVTFTPTDGSNYNTASTTASVTVGKATPTLVFNSANSTTINGTVTLNATSASTGNVTYTSSNNAVVSIASGVATGVAIGTATITASQAADSNYDAATANQTMTVTAAPVVLASFTFPATNSLVVSASATNLSVANVALSTGTIETNITTGAYFPNSPYIEESTGWTATTQATAKSFDFTITASAGYTFTITNVSFNAYATSAGPSAYGFQVAGTDIFSVNATSVALVTVNQTVTGQSSLTSATIKIQGWLNGSRSSAGSGAFRLDDLIVSGFVTALPPTVTAATINGTVGTPLSANITATNSPTSYAISSGTLPSGLSLNGTTGLISGTPTAAGNGTVVAVTATSAGGTSAPANLTFNIAPILPTIGSPTVSSITTTSSTLGATVTGNGGETLSARGTTWGTSGSPTGNALAEGGTAVSSFTHSRTDLTANTLYYYRGYATNSVGTAYTADGNFTTLPLAPTVGTGSAVSSSGFTANWSHPTMGAASYTYTLDFSMDSTFATGVTTVTGISSSSTSRVLTALNASTTYFYRVKAVNAQGSSDWSATSAGVSTPAALGAITTSGTLSAFTATYPAASAEQSFSVSGTDLTGSLTVTAPAGFEVSLTSGSGFGATAMISASGTLANTTVYVRLPSSATVGSYSGNVAVSGGDAATQNIAASGTVSQASQTITFGALATKNATDEAFALTATASSNLTVSYASSNTSVAIVAVNGTVTLVGAGSTTITASQAGNTNYAAATSVTQTLTVNKVSQTISGVNSTATKTYGDAAYSLGASVGSGLTINYTSSNTSVATIAANGTVTIVGAGSTTLTASQAGDARYSAAADTTQALTVSKATPTLSFSSSNSTTVNGTVTLNATSASTEAVTYTSSNNAVVSINGTVATGAGAGTAIITASQAAGSNYNAATANQTMTVAATPSVFASQDFEAIPATPTLIYSGANGTISSGTTNSTDGPGSSPYFSGGSQGYKVNSKSENVTFNSANTTLYSNISLKFRLASISSGGSSNGADVSDTVVVSISPDGGTTWYSQIKVAGNTNAYWGFAATGNASAVYSTSNTTTDFAPAGGGNRTADGFSTVTITSLPSVNQLQIKISLLNNSASEVWVIDDVQLLGSIPLSEAPVLTRATLPVAGGFTVNWNAATGAANYTVLHSASKNMTGATSVNTASTSLAITGLSNGLRYVQVRANNAAGASANSTQQVNQLQSIAAGAISYLSAPGEVGTNTVAGIFGSANEAGLASGATDSASTTILLLDSNGATANTIFYNSGVNQWREGATAMDSTAIPQGKAFMLKNNTGSTDYFLLVGSPRTSQPTVSLNPAGKFTLCTTGRTAPTSLADMNLNPGSGAGAFKTAAKAKDADKVIVVDQTTGAATNYYHNGTNWMDGLRAVPSATIPAGQGFFIKKASDSTFSTWTLPAE
jgi:hypothetical protein